MSETKPVGEALYEALLPVKDEMVSVKESMPEFTATVPVLYTEAPGEEFRVAFWREGEIEDYLAYMKETGRMKLEHLRFDERGMHIEYSEVPVDMVVITRIDDVMTSMPVLQNPDGRDERLMTFTI